MNTPPENCLFCNGPMTSGVESSGYRDYCYSRYLNLNAYYKYRLWGKSKITGVEINFGDILVYNDFQDKYTYINKYTERGNTFEFEFRVDLVDFDYSSPESVRKQLNLIITFL